MTEFSVVIPLYNKAEHIAETLRSALAQEHRPVEIIVVDDGSTDGGVEIAESYDDPMVKVFRRSPPGPGGYAARNLGVEKAKGEWIAFLDADDIWTPTHLTGLTEAIRRAGGSEAVGGAFSRLSKFSEEGEEAYSIAEELIAPGKPLDANVVIQAWLRTRHCPLWTGAVAFRRQLLFDVGGFPAGKARRGGDKDLWLRAMLREPLAFSPQISAKFRQDAVNRVTHGTAHTDIPIVVTTIAEHLPTGDAERDRLLQLLSNQELALYARHSAGRGTPVGKEFFRWVQPERKMLTAARILLFMSIAHVMQLWRPKRRHT